MRFPTQGKPKYNFHSKTPKPSVVQTCTSFISGIQKKPKSESVKRHLTKYRFQNSIRVLSTGVRTQGEFCAIKPKRQEREKSSGAFEHEIMDGLLRPASRKTDHRYTPLFLIHQGIIVGHLIERNSIYYPKIVNYPIK